LKVFGGLFPLDR